MTTKTKVWTAAIVLVVAAGSIGGYQYYKWTSEVVSVRASRVARQDLTQTVSANGEIKPKKYVNISSNAFGRIVHMPVKEGDRVAKGDLLVRIEAVGTEADVRSAEAGLHASEAELQGMTAQARSSEASTVSARAEVTRAEADIVRAQQAFTRAEQLSRDGLISREQMDRAKTDLDIATAQANAARARVTQTQAQTDQIARQAEGLSLRLAQQRAALVRARDQLDKTTIVSPLDGIITHLPVNEGEIAVVGVQSSPGTTLMTIADMSVITAEVQVDETDIVNLKVGQKAQVKVDALSGQILTGHVSEIGNSALTRSGAISNGPSNSQEAKDFKVVITLDNPPAALRPGLSCTASIVTATREAILTLPMQALTVREFDAPKETPNAKKIEKEGVFVIQNNVVAFRPVKTGIAGTTDIELLDGLSEGEQIVAGSFQALRSLADNTRIKIEE